MSRIFNAIKALLKGDDKKTDVPAFVPRTFEDLKIGSSFKIKICDVYDMVDRNFEVVDSMIYSVSPDQSVDRVLTIRCIDTNETFRAVSVVIDGSKQIRIDKLMSDEEVSSVFFDLNWVPAEKEEDWMPPADFRFIFDEDCNASFRLQRFNMGDDESVRKFMDWTSESYKFHENIGIQGFKEKNGYKEQIQYYFLINSDKNYGVVVENDEQGIARVYASHLMSPQYIIDML